MFYPEFLEQVSSVVRAIVSVALLSVVYALFAGAGYMVSIIWYRLNKIGRIIFAFGVLAVLSGYFLFGGRSMIAIMNVIMKLSGLADGNPFYGLISGVIGLVILAGFSILLIRKTVVRREN